MFVFVYSSTCRSFDSLNYTLYTAGLFHAKLCQNNAFIFRNDTLLQNICSLTNFSH